MMMPPHPPESTPVPTLRARITWTMGNLLILASIYALLLIGGVYTDAEYNRQAARGDSPLPLAEALAGDAPVSAASFTAPAGIPPAPAPDHSSHISRLVIPSIALDTKVIEMGKVQREEHGEMVSVWKVPNFVAGHHQGTANPGEGGNIVLSGHVGGYSGVFENLFSVKSGDSIYLYDQDHRYRYIVREHVLLDEQDATEEQRRSNASSIQPTDHELVTLVTCWPPTGTDRYEQRLIVRAVPDETIPEYRPLR